ncbi:MAG: leucine--tRNA ligase [Mollicutes bacterium]|nr:leucine--tRNA ligase [Mollicutes bacterium]
MYSKEIDKKWQKFWQENKINKFDINSSKPKYYSLEMFSYPSGSNLHVGHWYNYGPSDTLARFKHLQGYNLFHPMGFDSFGLPAENYAIKSGIHPNTSTNDNIKTMRAQLEEIGLMIDWDYTLETHSPEYYKWTQWIFSILYKNKLAYRAYAPVNWCTSCKTVLANEQVVDGHCERCESEVIQKKLNQWFFKITDYADELLDKIDDLDWPEKTKKIQTNWIGRSYGAEVEFKTEENINLKVFTTRPDTLYGVTYLVMAPENDLVEIFTKDEQKQVVTEYQNTAKKLTDIERTSTIREKTGVFTGSYAYNPVNNKKIPIWISDYVINSYGTGCVMAVPAHDERDFEFASKYDLEMIKVIEGGDIPYCDDGILINSMQFDNMDSKVAKEKIVEMLTKLNMGKKTKNYRLKDWLVSRQRYWGAPIPIVYCDDCGEVLVPEKDLPVLLPTHIDFKPDGESPLKRCETFINTTCPRCNKPAKRETDTLDTFVCSSWYYLRYTDPKDKEKAFDKDIVNKLLPVDTYIGGAEHATMHLIYARFITKALRDLGYLNFDEPFLRMIHQGMILGADGSKMSKSRGNTILPDDYLNEYGSDVFRLYLMFGFTYQEGGPWSDEGIKSLSRFVNRIDAIFEKIYNTKYNEKNTIDEEEKSLLHVENRTIKAVTEDLEAFSFNTAIARCMEYINELYKYEQNNQEKNVKLIKESFSRFITIFSPFAPHFSEEIWDKMGNENSIFNNCWPTYNEEYLELDSINLPIQLNGKLIGTVSASKKENESSIKEKVYQDEKLNKRLVDVEIIKVIYVPGRIYNMVIKKQ